MLIKIKKLRSVRGLPTLDVESTSELTEFTRLDVQKARQEARLARQEAQEIINRSHNQLKLAEVKAREIIQNANIEAQGIKEDVYKKTLQVAKVEVDNLKNEAKGLLRDLFEVKREALTQAHKEIMGIALKLAEKIIKYQASIDSNVFKTQVIEAIKKATSEADRVQVFVNPEDLKKLEEGMQEMKKLFPTGIDIIPLASDSVDSGSCIVETKSGQLDATFSTQLKALINLTSYIEVKEPTFEIYGEPSAPEEPKEEEFVEEEQDLLTKEEEELKEELLNTEPLIQLPVEEKFPFYTEQEENPIVEVPKEIVEEIKQVEEEQKSTKRKKLFVDSSTFPERTKEETEELNELDIEIEEETTENENVEVKSILRPKKTKPSGSRSHSQVSEIVSELEKSPEWENLVKDEEE